MTKDEETEWSQESEFTCHKFMLQTHWSCLVDQVKWFCERANRDRWQEETKILEAEFEQTTVLHTHMVNVWNQLADHCIQSPGVAAYARQKVAMYTQLAAECAHMYQDAKHTVRKVDLQASA
jgi:hypothetical protein